jgi:hypothetical protein
LSFNDLFPQKPIHQKTITENIDVRVKILRVAPAAATGCYREQLERARLNDSSSAGLLSLPVKSSLKVWVPQILPLWKNQPSWVLLLAIFKGGSVGRRRSVGKMTKNHIVCCVLILKEIEVRVMGVGLFKSSPRIARFLKQSQFDS